MGRRKSFGNMGAAHFIDRFLWMDLFFSADDKREYPEQLSQSASKHGSIYWSGV
jgi:hypothetical protein